VKIPFANIIERLKNEVALVVQFIPSVDVKVVPPVPANELLQTITHIPLPYAAFCNLLLLVVVLVVQFIPSGEVII